MRITQIQILNYRLLKDFTIDIESVLSLVIGKNNCGKTSFLSLLDKFLQVNDSNRFTFDDLNIEVQQRLKLHCETLDVEFDTKEYSLFLKLYIEYNETDNLSNISSIMLDLDPAITTVVLSFEYSIQLEQFHKLIRDFGEFSAKIETELFKKFETEKIEKEKWGTIIEEAKRKKDIIYFLKKYHSNYYRIQKKALEPNNEDNFIDLIKENIKIDKIINFKRIKAKRDVANEDGATRTSDKTLSKMSSKYYDKISNAEDEIENIIQLQNELSATDDRLNSVYNSLFGNIISKVKKFGGIKEDESKLMIVSTLEEKNLLSNNTTVMYEHGDSHSLPEDYNGLGYMNLIAIIFEIEVLLSDFKKKKLKEDIPADINLLFIEEPEAHTHPQMQYVFIKNIKTLLMEASSGNDDGIPLNLQTIITTHSSCIAAESDFNDLKYFHRSESNKVVAKNLKNLQAEYAIDDPKDYQFLKQYLTLNRSELFFADKAIFIEGDTERLLLPAIMKKIDWEEVDKNLLPLLSQNISIVEVGAYSHIFDKFISFLGIKTLIITDLDSARKVPKMKDGEQQKNADGSPKEVPEKCKSSEGTYSTNAAIEHFLQVKDLAAITALTQNNKVLIKNEANWVQNEEAGKLCLVFQTTENAYLARSFEDAFINLNSDFIIANKDDFKSLKNREDIETYPDAYEVADNCIDKKTLFALDILFFSDEKFTNWQIPAYIKDGLLWLKK